MSSLAPMRAASDGTAGHWLNEERIRVYSWMIVVIFAAFYVGWLWQSLPDLVDPRGKAFGNDFVAVWSAAHLAVEGRAADAYDWPTVAALEHATVPALPHLMVPFVYPPTQLLAILPLGFLSYPAALAAFLLVTTGLWALLVRRILPDSRAWIVAAATPAGLINIMIGQNGFLTAVLAGFALLWLGRRPVAAGVLIGLLCIKPHLALLFPVALVATGQWRTMLAAAFTALAAAAASFAAFGPDALAAFIRHMPDVRQMIDSGAVSWGLIPTPYVFGLSLGWPLSLASILQGAVTLFAAGCVWFAWRNPAVAFEVKAATLMSASMLASPYLSYYDLNWASLAIAWLALLGLRDGFRRGDREIMLLVWLLPTLMPPLYWLLSVQLIGFPSLLLLLLAVVRRARLTAAEARPLHADIPGLGAAHQP